MKKKIFQCLCITFCLMITLFSFGTAATDVGDYFIYKFEDYEHLDTAFTDVTSAEFNEIEQDALGGGKGESDKYFCAMYEGLSSKKLNFQTPMYKGEEAALHYDDGCFIALFSNKDFNVPWIWYYCDFEDFLTIVQTGFVDLLESEKTQGLETYKDYCKKLLPGEPTADTPKSEYADKYDSVTEEKLTLADGTQVTATVYKYNKAATGFDRKCYKFIYKGRVYSVLNLYNGDAKLFTEDFWSSFSAKEVEPSRARWEVDYSDRYAPNDDSEASEQPVKKSTVDGEQIIKISVSILFGCIIILLIVLAVITAVKKKKQN